MDKAARNRSNAASRNRYNAKSYQAVTFRLHQDGSDGMTAETIKAAAAAAGQSVNQWIIEALRDKL